MSKPVRFAAGLIVACLTTAPASSNPFTALFGSTPQPAAEPVPAKEECLSQPGKPVNGQHWMYRVDGRRKCWFMVPEETAAARKPARNYVAKRRLDADDDNKAALPRGKAVEDAHAELWRQAPVQAPQEAPPAPSAKVVDVADAEPAPATGAAALIPPPPVLSQSDQTSLGDSAMRRSNREPLFGATAAVSDATTVSAPAPAPVAVPVVETNDQERWSMSPWIGPLLMALGALMLLLGPIWRRQRAVALAESSWVSSEEEDQRGRRRSEFDPRMVPGDRRHTPATSRHPRQTIGDQRPSRSRRQREPDVTFQEAIMALSDFDPIPANGRSAALPPRRM